MLTRPDVGHNLVRSRIVGETAEEMDVQTSLRFHSLSRLTYDTEKSVVIVRITDHSIISILLSLESNL